jgi:hypothetical protein
MGEPDAAGDAELAEHLVQVVLHRAGADEQPGGDLPVGHALGGQPGDLRLLRGQRVHGPHGALAGVLAGGAQLGPGPLGERLHAHRVEHLPRGAELLPGVSPTPLPAQPLPVQQV